MLQRPRHHNPPRGTDPGLRARGRRPSVRAARRGVTWVWIVAGLVLGGGWFSPAAAKPLQIVLLGDSLTSPEDGRRSYRYYLWERLVESGLDFDFVGTQHDRPRPSIWTPTNGLTFDPDHEGHANWRIDHVINGRRDGSGSLTSWLDAYTPDVAVVMLGLHDALQAHRTEWSVREMRDVINTLRLDNDRVAILLVCPPPVEHENAKFLEEMSAAYTQLAEKENTVQSPVRFVDLFTGYDAATMLNADRNRPNSSGHRLIAERVAATMLLLDEAHLDPVRKTSAQTWGAVLVVPCGAALGFFLLARSQLRREKAALSYHLHRRGGSAAMPASTPQGRASRVGAATSGDGDSIAFPGN